MIRALARSRGLARRFSADRKGVTVVEFALVCPVFLLMLLGIFDIGQMAYAKAILNGVVEKAARNSALEGGDTTVADNMVKNAIKPILPNATIATSRKSYFDFSDISRPEKFTDSNGNGVCNSGEPYVDENGNGVWDTDIGKSGNGGSGDVVLYTVTVTYQPIFTAKFMSNWNTNRTMTAVGVRKNQPFSNQSGYGSTARVCT